MVKWKEQQQKSSLVDFETSQKNLRRAECSGP